jgi:hypothetical protein
MLGRLLVAPDAAIQVADVHELGTFTVAVADPAVPPERLAHPGQRAAVVPEPLVHHAEPASARACPPSSSIER